MHKMHKNSTRVVRKYNMFVLLARGLAMQHLSEVDPYLVEEAIFWIASS